MTKLYGCAGARPDRAATHGARSHAGWACSAAPVHDDTAATDDTEELRQFTVMLARRLARGQFDPEDLAHEVLERWLRAAPRVAPANPRAWVTVVLRRLLVDRLRRRRAAAEVPADGVALPAAEPDAVPWWREIDAGVLRGELERLPPALRETFELFSFQALSYQQIACQLDIAMGTVGTRISRARALLRRRLTEYRAAGHRFSARPAGVPAAPAGLARSTLRSGAAGASAGGRIGRGGSRSDLARELAGR